MTLIHVNLVLSPGTERVYLKISILQEMAQINVNKFGKFILQSFQRKLLALV